MHHKSTTAITAATKSSAIIISPLGDHLRLQEPVMDGTDGFVCRHPSHNPRQQDSNAHVSVDTRCEE